MYTCNVQLSSLTPSYSTKEKLIVSGKIALIALTTIAVLGAAAAVIYLSLPLALGAAVGLSILGFGLIGASAGAALGSIVTICTYHLLDQGKMHPMHKKTDQNIRDCLEYLQVLVSQILNFGAIGAIAGCSIGFGYQLCIGGFSHAASAASVPQLSGPPTGSTGMVMPDGTRVPFPTGSTGVVMPDGTRVPFT